MIQSAKESRPVLQKAIGRLGFFSLAFGSMIGVGWITGLKGLFGQAGPVGTTVAFAAGGMLILVIGLCYAEAMKLMPVTGGEVAYAYRAYGTSKAYIVGWCLAIGYLSVSAFEAVSVGIVLSYIVSVDAWPLYDFRGSTVYGSHVLIAAMFTAFIAFINHRGVGLATMVQTGLALMMIAFALGFVTAGFINGSIENIEPAFVSTAGKSILGGILAVFVTVPFWFVGFDTIPQAAEERVEGFPAKRLGQVLVLSIVGATLFYVAVFMSVAFTTPWQTIIEDPLPTAAAFRTAFGSPFWARLVLTVGLIGLLTSWNGFFLSGCRVLFALGRGHIIHPAFGRTHSQYGTPTVAIVFAAVITLAGALLGRQAVLVFVNVGSLCISLAFFGVAVSLSKVWRVEGMVVSPFKRLLPIVAGAGSLFIIAAMLVPGSPAALPWPIEWVILALVAALGAILWFGATGIRSEIDEETRRRLVLNDERSGV